VWLLIGVAVFAAGVRYGIVIWDGTVVDVGYAGVAGGTQVLDGHLPYGLMPSDNPHGDTYGPLNYLFYAPFVSVFGGTHSQVWGGDMPAAHAVAIAADLMCVAVLAWIGWRWMSGRAGALLAAAWMTCPFTAYAAASNVNDGIVAAFVLLAFALLRYPLLRGVALGAAVAVKFIPLLALTPLLHCGGRSRRRQACLVAAGVVLVGAVMVGYIAAFPHGLERFADATWRFQYDRDSPFSIWGMYDWRLAQQIAQGILVLILAGMMFIPRVRDFRQVAAGMAAALIGAQLVLQHWFYLYVPWFLGLVFIVLVAQRQYRAALVYSRA
jgi:hypothetical protein